MGLVSLQIVLCLILGINSFKIQLQDFTQSIGTIPTYLTTSSFTVKVEQTNGQTGQMITFQLFASQINTRQNFEGQSFCITDQKGGCLLENLIVATPGSYYFEAYNELTQIKSEVFNVEDPRQKNAIIYLEEGNVLPGFYLEFISVSPSEIYEGSEFEVKVGLYDKNSTALAADDSQSAVDLTLSQPDQLQGTTSVIVQSGIATFSGLKISEIGSYNLTASSSGLDSVTYSQEILIQKWPLVVYLEFVSVTPSEIFDGSEFEVKVGLYDKHYKTLVAEDSNSIVDLTLSQPDQLQGTTSVIVQSGIATFSGLKISEIGSYNITASSSGLDSVTYSQEILIQKWPLVVYLEFISVTPSEIFDGSEFEVKVGLYDKHYKTLVAEDSDSVVNLTLSQPDQLQGTTSVIVQSGIATFSGLKISEIGSYNLTASSSGLDSVTYSQEILIQKWPLVVYLEFVSVTPSVNFIQEIFEGSEFEVKVGLYDKHYKTLVAEDSDSVVNLTLSQPDLLEGNTSIIVQSGIATFSGLKIADSGSYNITASSLGLDSVTYSQEILIQKWPLNRLDVSMPNNLTSYFEFELQVDLIDGSEKQFLDEVEVTLESNLTLLGTTSVTSSEGKAIFKVYTKDNGPVLFTVSSGSISNSFEHFLNIPIVEVSEISEITQSSNVFNISVKIFDYEQKTLLTLTSLNISLSLSPTGELYGNTSTTSSTGEAIINDIVIISGGSYNFLVTVYDIDLNSIISTSKSAQYEITEEQSNLPVDFQDLTQVKIETSNSRPTIYFTFQVHIYLYNQIGKSYDQTCQAGIVGSTLLHGGTYKETESGQASFEIYSKELGNLNILATVCDTFSRSIELEILPLSSKITVTEHIDSDSNYFDIKIGIYDNEMVNIESTNVHYNATLSLSPSGQLTGSTNYPHVPGEWTFQRVSILSTGNFTFKVSVSEEGEKYLFDKKADTYFLITKQNAKVPPDLLVMSEITVDTHSNVSVFEPFYINTTIKDQEGSLWVDECNIVINANMTLYGETSKIATEGEIEFQIYFKDVGYAKVTILTCDGLTKSFEVVVLPYTQKVTYIPHIENDSNYFDVLVEIYDSFGENILDTYGSFDIELYLIPDGNLTSNSIGTTVKGSKYFSPVTILTPGDYQLAIDITEKSGLQPIENPYLVNETFEITEENCFIPKNLLILSYLEVTLNVTEPTVFFAFEIKVELFDQINSTWHPPTLVDISSDEDLFGEVSQYSDDGKVTFVVFFKNNGKHKLIIRAESGLHREIQVNVLRERLQIEPIFKFFDDSHYFNVTVDVLDNSYENIESNNGNYSVTLYSVPDSEIHGNLTANCEYGVCVFTGISIKNNGTYRLAAKLVENSIEDVIAPEAYTEASYKITEDIAHIYLHQIEVYQKSECSEYMNSELNVLLLDINRALYNESIEFTISSSDDYSGPSSLVSTDGNSTFKFFYTQVGFEEIDIAASSITEPILIEVKQMTNYPLLALIVLFWFMIVFCVVFYVNDKSYLENEFSKFGLHIYCPVLTFLNPGSNQRRIITALRVFASLFMIFTILGLFYNYEILDSPQTEDGFEAYGLEDWYEGFIVLLISQSFTFPFAFLHYFNIENSALAKLIATVSIMVIILCLIFAIWGIVVFTAKYYLFWVITFCIYAAIELFIVHSLYGILFFCFFYKPQPHVDPMTSPTIKSAQRPLIQGVDKRISLQPDESPVRAPRISFLYRK